MSPLSNCGAPELVFLRNVTAQEHRVLVAVRLRSPTRVHPRAVVGMGRFYIASTQRASYHTETGIRFGSLNLPNG